MTATGQRHDVAVVGCGLMGAALAQTLADHGRAVAVWNRTPERAERLAREGITPVRAIEDAVPGTPLIIACTADYATTRSSLAPVRDWDGTTLVNLGTSVPAEAESMAEWAAERGVPYLDGSLLTFPEFVGSPDALVLYSGSPEVWSAHEKTLRCLGGKSQHISERIGAASAVDSAMIGSFYVTAMGAYLEAASYAKAQGVPAEMLRETTKLVLRTIGHSSKEAAAAIESGDFSTDQATLETYAAGAKRTAAALRADGRQPRLLEAAVTTLEEADAAGFGKLGLYAQALLSLPRQDGKPDERSDA
ncbi:NAD(P)-dependent oxidoreductase [Amycolatopsis sp. cg13]|uniref:NAD(P)-dependent oxidoreductase n=1 Tax=Amycolatopsis sp. cg13 TaxID=3238807 RepID=UPI0035266957